MLPRRASVLVVGLATHHLPVEGLDSGLELAVVRVDDYASAVRALAAAPPDVLITNLRLGAHNGLHLVLRGRDSDPSMVALVVAEAEDTVLRRDAEALGATFIVGPLRAADVRAALTDAGLTG